MNIFFIRDKNICIFLYFSRKQIVMAREEDIELVRKQLNELRYDYYSFRLSIIYKSLFILVCFVFGLIAGFLL